MQTAVVIYLTNVHHSRAQLNQLDNSSDQRQNNFRNCME
jgi:hypothetical protein